MQILHTVMQFSRSGRLGARRFRLLGLPILYGNRRALTSLLEDILTTVKTLTESASQLGNEARESIEELGRSAGRKLGEAQEETGAALHTAASSVRKTGRQGSEAIDNLATSAADRLDATASYVENHDLHDAFVGLRRFGRRHLAGSLVAAVTIGFFAGSGANVAFARPL